MQSKISFFNPTLFKKNLSRTWVVGLVYFILLLVMIPIVLILTISNGYDVDIERGYTVGYWLLNILSNIPGGFLSALWAIITVMFTFGYLFAKRDAYMMHSFPTDRKSLYFTGLCSSLVTGVVPVVLVAIITTIIAVAAKSEYIVAIWYWALVEIGAYIFFVGFALFSIMLTGQAITAVVFYGILNFVCIGIEFTFKLLMSTLCFGLNNMIDDMVVNPLTPIAYINENCRIGLELKWDENWNKIIGLEATLDGAAVLMAYIAVGIVFVVLGYLLYKYKKLETVNDFITVPFVKPIFSIGIAFFVSVVFAILTTATLESGIVMTYNKAFAICIVAALIYGVIFYYVTLMLIAKSVRVFKMQNAIHCACYTMCALAVLLLIRFDAFGIERKIPETSEIEWAGIATDHTFVVRDEEEINLIKEIHQATLDDKKEIREMAYLDTRDESNRVHYVNIKYRLKNGKTITRSYEYAQPDETYSDTYESIVDNTLAFVNEPQRIKEHIIGPFYDNCTVQEFNFNVVKWNEEDGYYTFENLDPQFKNTGAKLDAYEELYKALLKDIDAGVVLQEDTDFMTDDDDLYNDLSFYIKAKSGTYWLDDQIMYGWGDGTTTENDLYIVINRKCVNTLAKLKEYGFYNSDDDLVDYKEVRSREDGQARIY